MLTSVASEVRQRPVCPQSRRPFRRRVGRAAGEHVEHPVRRPGTSASRPRSTPRPRQAASLKGRIVPIPGYGLTSAWSSAPVAVPVGRAKPHSLPHAGLGGPVTPGTMKFTCFGLIAWLLSATDGLQPRMTLSAKCEFVLPSPKLKARCDAIFGKSAGSRLTYGARRLPGGQRIRRLSDGLRLRLVAGRPRRVAASQQKAMRSGARGRVMPSHRELPVSIRGRVSSSCHGSGARCDAPP